MSEGYIYILLNPSLRAHRYKIGMTSKTPKERAADISRATGVPEPFEVAYSKKVRDCKLAEQIIMERLEEKRISTNREFFDIELQDAVNTLNMVADEVGVVGMQVPETTPPNDKRATGSSPPEGIGEEFELTIHVPPKRVRKSGGTAKRGRKTIEEHLEVCQPEIRDLFQNFRAKVMEIAPHIQENSWSYGVAYRASQNFVEMYFRTNRLEICLRPTVYSDPKGLLGKVPENYNWTLNRRFLLEDEGQIDYLITLVKQSYENVA